MIWSAFSQNHWVAAVIYMQRKEIVMYDSLYGKDNCISYREGLFRFVYFSLAYWLL